MAFAALTVEPALAAPGDPDPSFSDDGKETTDFGGLENASAVAVQADGKILAVGATTIFGPRGNLMAAVESLNPLARYNADGSLDMSFGAGGAVTTGFGASAMTLQPDGKIVVAGGVGTDAEGTRDFALARFHPDGSPDTGFGSGGRVTTDFGTPADASSDELHAVAIGPDSKIVAVGSTRVSAGSSFALARYNANGSPDEGFGSGGQVAPDPATSDELRAVALQPDGKIVAAGRTTFGATGNDFALVRYNPTGRRDESFGSGGKVATNFGFGGGPEVVIPSSEVAFAVALQRDGNIVAAGITTAGGTNDFALVRYTPNGNLDTSFGSGGKVATDFGGFEGAAAVALQPDDRIVVAGTSSIAEESSRFALARYTPNGNLDTSFGSGGRVATGFLGRNGAAAVALQPDGKVVAAGGANDFTDFGLARYQGGPPETTITSGPQGLTNDATPTFTFSSTLAASSFQCRIDGGPPSPCASPHTTAALSDGSHIFEVRAIDSSGNADATPASRGLIVDATPEGLPPPVLGKTFNIEPLSGRVFVSLGRRTAGASRSVPGLKGRNFVRLRAARQLPIGSFIDTRDGKARITSARDETSARLQSGAFSAGVFQVLQSRRRSAKGLTELRLKGSSFGRCRRLGHGRRSVAARHSRRRIRRVRGDARGRFQTRGRYSAATVRGTVWTVADRCDGTLTKVTRGSVAVRDLRRRKTVIVGSGKNYLARARR